MNHAGDFVVKRFDSRSLQAFGIGGSFIAKGIEFAGQHEGWWQIGEGIAL